MSARSCSCEARVSDRLILGMQAPALFLDRDGVINEDGGYTHRIEDFRFIDDIFDIGRQARQLGWRIFVITNQAGIGRGLYTEADFLRLTEWMQQRFVVEQAPIDRVYFCPYHPTEALGDYRRESPMRKPNPGMILQARDEFGIDLARSVLIGDKASDIEAGRRAGVGTNLWFRPGAVAADTPADPRYGVAIGRLRQTLAYIQAAAAP